MTKDKALEFSVLREYLRQQGRAYKIIEQDGTAWLADGVDTYEVFDREHALLMILAGITAAMLYVPPEIIQSSASKDVPRALVRRMQERGLDGLQQIIAITADEKRLCETIAEQYDVRELMADYPEAVKMFKDSKGRDWIITDYSNENLANAQQCAG